jgi:hypothetical protein
LFNLKDDIGEQRNLADDMPDKVRQLQGAMAAWQKRVDAPIPTTPNPEYDAAARWKPRDKRKARTR